MRDRRCDAVARECRRPWDARLAIRSRSSARRDPPMAVMPNTRGSSAASASSQSVSAVCGQVCTRITPSIPHASSDGARCVEAGSRDGRLRGRRSAGCRTRGPGLPVMHVGVDAHRGDLQRATGSSRLCSGSRFQRNSSRGRTSRAHASITSLSRRRSRIRAADVRRDPTRRARAPATARRIDTCAASPQQVAALVGIVATRSKSCGGSPC